ncbi:MAG TPA: recombinase family protein [Thermoanaerobaculia bacterium]|jgi:DNA invertase Pin-like site-specific DNA recombinase|nr:recombinase family protein [Thermoanaerobaculia bacterium]
MRRRSSATIRAGLRAALYLRRSTNDLLQADSLEVQGEILRAAAERLGFVIVAIFRESASGRTDDRTEFRRLMDCVTSGAAEFDVILVRDVSRWGRFDNIDESAYHEFVCLRHGVAVVYVEEEFDSSPYGAIQKMIKRFMAAEFSREKSRIISRGKERAASLGYRSGGSAPYGMKRVLVERSGAVLQDLPPGVQKVVSNLKVKMAPANDDTAEVVRRMFRMLVDDDMSVAAIATRLNAESIPAPRGGRWHHTMVLYVLKNEIYAGTIVLRPASGNLIRVERAHSPVISPAIFAAAQERIAALAHGPIASREKLLTEARSAVERCGSVPPDVLRWLTRRTTMRKPLRPKFADLMRHAFETTIGGAKREITVFLERYFNVEPQPNGLLLDGCITVGWSVGFVRRDLVRRPAPFKLPDGPWDVAICIAVDPASGNVVERCFTHRERVGDRRSLVWNINATMRKTALTAIGKGQALTRCLNRLLTAAALHRRLLSAVNTGGPATLARLQRDLGMSALHIKETARVLEEQAVLPKGAIGRTASSPGTRVTVTCPLCGYAREMRPSDAAALRSGRCRHCKNKRPVNKLEVRCPNCGAERSVWPCQIRDGGPNSLCHPCALAKGRDILSERRRAAAPLLAAKYAFLRNIALVMYHTMTERAHLYVRPCLWSIARSRLATLRWHSPIDQRANRLTLDCGPDLIARLTKTDDELRSETTLADGMLDASTWIPLEPRAGDRCWLALIR